MTSPHRRRWLAVAAAGAAVAAAMLPTAVARAAGPAPAACNWTSYGRDPGHSFAAVAGCSKVTPASAPALVPKWFFHTPDSVTASAAVVDGTVYVGDWAGTFYALPADLPLGSLVPEPKWTFQIDDTDGVAFGRIVSSAAVVPLGGRKVVVFGGGSTLYVLDAGNGHELASLCLDPRDIGAQRCRRDEGTAEIESSPALVPDGRGGYQIVVGTDVHNDRGVARTGVVSLSLRIDEGGYALRPRWKFDPEDPSGIAYTGDDLLVRGSGTGNGCGGVWASPAVDLATNRVFFGTSSCSVDGITTGEQLWGVRLDTGDLAWRYSPPRTSTRLDDDFGASPNLLPGGVVGNGNKDGHYYAVSRLDGALKFDSQPGEPGHVQTDFAVGGVIGTPAVGTVKGEPAVFVTTAISTPIASPLDGGPTLDPTLLQDPLRMLSLHAISATTGRVLWRAPTSRQSYGAPTVANGVVLVPSTFDFTLDAFAADTGLPLSVLPLPGAPSSAPVPVGDSVFIGVGTRTTDAEFKAFHANLAEEYLGASPLSPASGVVALRVLR